MGITTFKDGHDNIAGAVVTGAFRIAKALTLSNKSNKYDAKLTNPVNLIFRIKSELLFNTL